MTALNQEKCPLCGTDAEFEYIYGDSKKRQYFNCSQCKEFIIADIAKRKLMEKPLRRQKLSRFSATLEEGKLSHIFFDEREIKCIVDNKADWR